MILSRILLHPQERFDLEDHLAQQSAARSDSKLWTQKFLSSQNLVIGGFSISGIGLNSATVSMANAALIIPQNTFDFSYFISAPSEPNVTITDAQLTDGVRNYVEIELTTLDGVPLTKAFWSQEANAGAGNEFNQIVNTITDVRVSFVVSTGGFSGDPDRLPIAIIDTNGSGVIKVILDRREMYGRLAKPNDLDNEYPWGTKSEPAYTLVMTGAVGVFVAGETITIGTETATVVTGGTSTITFKRPSGISFANGDSVTGGTSGATGTVNTILEAFTGVDKSLATQKDINDALMTEIKLMKGTPEWWSDDYTTFGGLTDQINSLIVQAVANARWEWDGAELSITDNDGTPASSDILANVRLLGDSRILNLLRQDGQASTTTISIADEQVLFVKLPASGTRSYSGEGSGDTNYQVVARNSYTPNDTNYWIAYRQGAMLYVRHQGELRAGESEEIGDNVPQSLLDNIGLADEVSAPSYSSNIRGSVGESIVSRSGVLTDAVGDEQEDRSAFLRSADPVSWDGADLTFTSDIVLEIINTKSGTTTLHTILASGSPISLTNGQIAYVTINRTSASENVVPTIGTSTPAQVQATKDVIVLFKRIDAGGAAFLHVPLHKQVIEQAQTVRLGASGSGSGTSGINYISANPGFESNTNGWERYADAAGAVPVDGTGGAPNVNFTLTRSVSDPLRGVASGLITKDAANRQGHGVSFDFTIDRADEAKPQSVEFDYEVSANFVAGSDSTISDVVAYMYDLDYGQVIQLTPYKIVGGFGSKHKFLATFQTSAASGGADSRKFRLILHVATTNASAWTFKFDNVRVGPQLVNYGSPVTDWDGHGWTPTGSFVTNTTYNPGKWRRVGDSMELFASLSFTGAPNAGPFTINLPPGYTLDTNKLASTGNANSPLGIAIAGDTGAGGYHGVVGANNSTSLLVGATNPGPSVNWSDVFPFTFGNTDTISIFALVPIVGWSSTVEMSNDTDTRVAAARASTAATTIDNTTPTVINGTEDYDTHSAYNPANGRYTAQVAGYYRVDTSIRFNSQTYAPGDILELSLFKNGVLYSILDRFVVETVLTDIIMLDGNDVVKLVAGDYLEVRAYNDVSTALDGSASGNHTAFTKYSGPSQVAASEKVAAIFETDTASAMNNSSDTIVDFEDLVYDSHNAVTTGATWKFTAPSAGVYKISAMTHSDGGGPWTAGESWDMKLFKNGVFVRSLGTELMQANHTERANISGSANIYLNAGDYIDIRVNQNSGAASLNLSGDPGYNHVSIEKS